MLLCEQQVRKLILNVDDAKEIHIYEVNEIYIIDEAKRFVGCCPIFVHGKATLKKWSKTSFLCYVEFYT